MASNKSQKRELNQRKVARPGRKSLRGVAETDYGEPKQVCSYSLTPTCRANLQDLARQIGCSASELLEQFSRCAPQFQLFLQSLKKRESLSLEEPSTYIEAESPNSRNPELFELPE